MPLMYYLSIICLMQILSNANIITGKYTVIAPGTIHCNEKYTAAVALHNTSQPCRIKVGITSRFYSEHKQIEIGQNEVKKVDFVLPCFEKGDFNLTAEGIDCLDNFKNSTKLIYSKFNNHVIIQTDKDLYEPGDDINFRVLFLDKDLKPTRPEKDAVIWFEDAKDNRIKEIKNFKTIKGVYTGKFKISNFPVAGDWYLGVRNGGGFDRSVHLQVAKNVLPKFLVEVEAVKSISIKDGYLHVTVRAHYSYGKPLDGKVTVVLLLESYNYYQGLVPPMLSKTTKMFKGKAKLDLNIFEYDAYLTYENSPFYITIIATVEENNTGIKVNGTAVTNIYFYRYTVNCLDYDAFATFEVDEGKDVVFHVTYIDGSYINDTKSTVELTYKEVLRKSLWWHHERTLNDKGSEVVTTMKPPLWENFAVSFNGHMNETGFATFKVALPDLPQYEGYLHYYSLELKYLDEQKEVCSTHLYWDHKQVNPPKKEEENSKEYLILEDKYLSANKLYLKTASQFTLNSTRPLSYFNYNVIGRGNILESGRIELPDKPKVYDLTLNLQFSWAPNFCVYVNYVDEKGKYHFAEQIYSVDFELENQINVTVAKQVAPGKEVAFKIQTAPHSFVGLTVVDQTRFPFRSNNELNFYELNRVLGSYNTYTLPQGGYSTYPGEMSGCITLTNADYFYIRTRPKNTKRELQGAANADASINSDEGRTGFTTHAKAPKEFLHTWMFADIENTEAAEFTWNKTIPETITSWVLTAFSLSPRKGLGLTREQTKITTFLPFFISIRLPYSVKRGEVINVPAWVFNYLGEFLDVEVTLRNIDDEYEFIEFDNKVIRERKLSKNIRVPANGAAGVSFLIKPKVLGNIMLKFTAISPVAGDAIHKTMKVVPEGITHYINRAYFVHLNKEPELKTSVVLKLPQDVVPGTEHVEVGAMGDILGPVLNNLDNLVRLPTGCGEHTMSTLLFNYLIMNYLKDSKRLTPTMEATFNCNLETGYQNILSYRLADGSFSNFGPSQIESIGSTLLTAYVVRSLQQIKEFINVDSKIIEDGLAYLITQQTANGTFTGRGDYSHDSQKYDVTLTGAAILAIIENTTYAEKYSEELRKGLGFIAQNIGKSDSLHAQAIGTFSLNKAKHIAAEAEIPKLKLLAKTKSDRIWWPAEKQRCGHRCYPFNSDVEATSYAFLTLLDQHCTKIDDVLPIINWLIAQRNSHGGFASTHDTVVGLTALIEFAKFAGYEPAKMTVNIESKEKRETINLDKDNELLYQNIEMPPETKSIKFTANGTGLALVQIAYKYNVFKDEDSNAKFSIKISDTQNKNTPARLNISVCVTYKGEGESWTMAILEFYTPTGYVIDDASLKEIKKSMRVRSTELKYSDTLLVVYFDHLYNNGENCFPVEVIRTHAVAMQKPAPIVLYEYYDANKRVTAFYEVEAKLCDICETEEECSKCK